MNKILILLGVLTLLNKSQAQIFIGGELGLGYAAGKLTPPEKASIAHDTTVYRVRPIWGISIGVQLIKDRVDPEKRNLIAQIDQMIRINKYNLKDGFASWSLNAGWIFRIKQNEEGEKYKIIPMVGYALNVTSTDWSNRWKNFHACRMRVGIEKDRYQLYSEYFKPIRRGSEKKDGISWFNIGCSIRFLIKDAKINP